MSSAFRNSVVVAMALFFLGACKSKKVLVQPEQPNAYVEPVNRRIQYFKDSIATPLCFDYLSFKVQSEFEGKDLNLPVKSVKVNVRIYKDSVIWASVTALLGVEAARILIKNDSVFMLNRFESTLTYGPIHKFVPALPEGVSIASLIQFLLGKPILPISAFTKDDFKVSSDTVLVAKFLAANTKSEPLRYNAVANKYLSAQSVVDASKNRHVKAFYSDFHSFTISNTRTIIPLKQQFSIFNGSTVEVMNTYSAINTDVQTLSFKIPSNYKKIAY